ncbi:hypothetical protein [Streptomyces sp. NPDC048603]|uniref:hypothetical protein n=1 Tax=Streptomyces sp. NPDC048603 TaxID=3365577 RepID=UPI003723B2C6
MSETEPGRPPSPSPPVPPPLLEGVAELRKRAGHGPVAEECLESLARRAAEKAGRPRMIDLPCGS